MKHAHCPSCNSMDLEIFYEIRNAPVFSLVTVKSHEEAMRIPRKDISLALCSSCGFIFNASFDTSIDFFTRGYEDQQGFSPTFVSFITSVTNRFIEKYDIREKTVVEIGSGKGDFLSLISKLGNNEGIGIDPAWVPGRQTDHQNLEFIKEFYNESHGKLNPDCICCRHTFEHIHDTADFMGTIKRSIRNDRMPILFFEVPSIIRILQINAFWDIFYEHCSYFGPGSLARLFRGSGFDVLDLYLENNDQYLFIEAQPATEAPLKSHAIEEPVESLKQLVGQFARNTNLQLTKWRNKLLEYKNKGQKVVVWGGGSKSVGFLTHFHDLGVIEHVIDINPHMTGNYIPGIGLQYSPPEFLKEYRPDKVIIMNGVYQEEIGKMINEMGLFPELESLDSVR